MYIDASLIYNREPIYGRQNISLLKELTDLNVLLGSIDISPLRGSPTLSQNSSPQTNLTMPTHTLPFSDLFRR